MWTIIWIGLGWMALSVLMAWVWHRLRISEYRAEYTQKEVLQDCAESNLDETDEHNFSKTDSATFAGMGEAEKAMKERLGAIFSKDDPDEASPEDRENVKSIKDIVSELMFIEDGKEARS